MPVIIYVRQKGEISLYEQYNKCADHAKKHGYSVAGKILDFDGKRLHEAINKIIPAGASALIVYSKEAAFDSYDDYIFYRIYLEKLGHKLILCY